MKKSLIALAVAGAFAATPAVADVTLSGAINFGLLYGSTSGANPSKTSLNGGYSNFNLTSVDDIGGGNKVVFNFSFNVEGDSLAVSAPTSLGNRNSYLGIMGDWGALKWGTNENVYERMMYETDFLDGAYGPGGNLLILGNPGVGGAFDIGQDCDNTSVSNCSGFYRRSNHTVWYTSPNWEGFSFEVDYTLSAYKTNATNPQIISIGGKYAPDGMPFRVDVAYEQHDDMFGANAFDATNAGTSSKDTGLQVGGTYMFGDFTVGLRYEMLEYKVDNAVNINKVERDAWFINGKMNLPTGYAAVQFGMAGDRDINGTKQADSGAKMIGVGYFHNLSRQSQMQIIYNQTDNDANANYLAIGGTNASNGLDHKGIYLGIKHTF
jgi:predicted porin